MVDHLARGILLYQQSNFQQAEKELALVIGADPDNAVAHALFASCLGIRKEFEQANQRIDLAISLAPDDSLVYFVKSSLAMQQAHLKEAHEFLERAIALEPYHAFYYAHLAELLLVEDKLVESLKASDHGLSIDPEEIDCINSRAKALVRLGRDAEAEDSLQFALIKDPDNAVTHANIGWTLLRRGKIQEAMDHLKEGLRIDPNSEFAREGVLEALKARNPVYHKLLKGSLYLAELDGRVRFVLLIMLIFVYPFRLFFFLILLIFWTSNQLFNTLLRFDSYGRIILSEDQIRQSNFFIGAWVLLLGFCTCFYLVPPDRGDYDVPPPAVTESIERLHKLALLGRAKRFQDQFDRLLSSIEDYRGTSLPRAEISLAVLTDKLAVMPKSKKKYLRIARRKYAEVLMEREKFQEAKGVYQSLLPATESGAKSKEEIESLSNLGFCYFILLDYELARKYYERAEAALSAAGITDGPIVDTLAERLKRLPEGKSGSQ